MGSRMLDIRTTFAAATAVLLTAAAVFSTTTAQAAESQFYFLGRVVVNNAVQPARTEVYLRWNVLEGQLPPDVTAFRVVRNGVAIEPDFPALTVKSAPEIAGLYQEPGQSRRRLETITRLAELASDAGRPFSANQFAGELHALIDPASETFNPLWSMLGSRTDFNVARARNRAWIDTAPAGAGGGNLAGYELLAVNAAGATVKVGELEIDLTQVQQPLGATEFRQIRVTDYRCDLPESGKDHFTVMLDWASPGAAVVTDRVAAQAYIAGFDVYRTTDNLDPSVMDPPARDIAALAAGAGVDSRGRPQIPGLEKVNVSLIVDPGKRVADADWVAARDRLREAGVALPDVPAEDVPVEPKWLEARDTLARAGVRPGDRRAYYLVPRDFTGNYGPTAATIVEVPYLTRPPAPWNVRTFPDRTSPDLTGGPETLALTWDEVNVDTYAAAYTGTRLFCNVVEATTTGLLEYAPLGGNCGAGRNNSVRLDVNRYRVYRFTDFDVAGRFRDSDGDGVEDKAEIPDLDGNKRYDLFERSLGTQCDGGQWPEDAPNYLVWPANNSGAELSIPRQLNSNARPVVRLRDRVPAFVERDSQGNIITDNRDAVYWYRIASEATTPAVPVGRLSHLSSPQRGIFPDRDPPPPPVVDVTKPGEVPNGCRAETEANVPWSFEEDINSEQTNEKDVQFTVSCADGSYSEAFVDEFDDTACEGIRNVCGKATDVSVTFNGLTGTTGGVQCSVTLPDEIRFCQSGSVRIVPDLVDGQVAAEPGDLVPGGVTVTVNHPDDPTSRTCIALFENMDGTATRVGSTCDPDGLINYRPRGGQFCGYAIVSDENNNLSAVVHIPCTLSPSNPKPPAPPQILSFDVDDELARFTFRLPAEQVATALARLVYEPAGGESSRSVESIPVIGEEPGTSVSFNVAVDPRQGTKDRYCLSMLSVGREDGNGRARTSDWSAERCFTRTASGEDLPEYLPWPLVAGVPQGEPLAAALVTGFRQLQPFLALELAQSPALLPAPNGIQDFPDCQMLRPGQANVTDPVVPEIAERNFDTYQCLSGGLARSRQAIRESLKFILYRQSRVAGGVPSDWIQVSPLIDYVHFDREVIEVSDRNISIWTLNDPYVELVDESDFTGAGVAVWFVDRYPFRLSRDNAGAEPYEWRYQAVYFDENQAPVEWRVSDWVGGAN
ncbi:hypothetical protein [Lentisalinibacter sediminis]|uniref:hypothetical protein n=1 Tax=Lentisalinibacter sediminis TaxID=2992237 RepID=UPI003866B15D